MQNLNLPSYPVKIKRENNVPYIFDSFRLKWLKLTPEEWVRQHFAQYLVNDKQFPKGRVALEYSIKINSLSRRCDIVMFNSSLRPTLIVECKAPSISINQKTFDQIARYNFELKVEYLVVTNGLQHFACKIDYKNMDYAFLKAIPDFTDIEN